jgi:catechol 2,3-dioxygenase-like lactoylglutathione lyase family enzyme
MKVGEAPPPCFFNGCNHVAIGVDDLAKAQAFYEDVFGLKLSRVAYGTLICGWQSPK